MRDHPRRLPRSEGLLLRRLRRKRAAKRIAQAKGAAEAERISAESEARAIEARTTRLTPEYLQYQAIQRWNGQLPATMMGPQIPFLPSSLGRAFEDAGVPSESAPKKKTPGAPSPHVRAEGAAR
jgi:regulator of protease activity HflC (stomatin/prohibitin superfamily)